MFGRLHRIELLLGDVLSELQHRGDYLGGPVMFRVAGGALHVIDSTEVQRASANGTVLHIHMKDNTDLTFVFDSESATEGVLREIGRT